MLTYLTNLHGLAADRTFEQSTDVLKRITNTLFDGNSLVVLIVSLVVATVLGKILSIILRRVSREFGRHADAATNLASVNRFRRLETWTILWIAIARVLLVILGLYFWWSYTHPSNGPSALVGASAIFIIIIGGVVSPLLRDFAFGSGMMAEHWFGVGDLITVVPYPDVQGVVERITLRSTRIRGLNGEVIWMANQNIQGVRIAQKGVWTMAIELFVTEPKAAERLIEHANALLPAGPSLLATPLGIMSCTRRSKDLWHITAIGETAPGREWLLEKTAVELIKNLDEKSHRPVLIADPFARYADNDTERQFARAVNNAKKSRRKPRTISISNLTKKSE
jgi:moderate conductance mechanosensitive channel